MKDSWMQHSQTPAMASTIQVSENDGRAAEWDEYVATHPQATFFHQYQWLTLVRETYGGTPHYLTAYQEGRIVGVLPLMQRRVIGPGRILISVPFADEGGLIADSPEAQAVLLEAAAAIGKREGVGYVELRQTFALGADLPVDLSRVTLKLALPAGPEALWASFQAKVRNQTRKAERAGLIATQVEALHEGMKQSFYPVYSHNTRDLGSPMHAEQFFHALVDLLPNKVFLVQVRLEALPVGAAVAVSHNGVFSVPWASSLRSHFEKSPNNLLYWKLMQMAIEQGCSTFDFGRSAKDSGTYRFKLQWGAEELPLHYSFLAIQHVPQIGEKREGALYQAFVKIWQKTPLPIARAVGPKLFARLPI